MSVFASRIQVGRRLEDGGTERCVAVTSAPEPSGSQDGCRAKGAAGAPLLRPKRNQPNVLCISGCLGRNVARKPLQAEQLWLELPGG